MATEKKLIGWMTYPLDPTGKRLNKDKENARRRSQIERGMLKI